MAFLTHSCLYLTSPAFSSSRNSLGEAEFSRAPDTRVGPACSSARLRREVLCCLRNERGFRPRQPGFSLLRVREPEGPGTRLAGREPGGLVLGPGWGKKSANSNFGTFSGGRGGKASSVLRCEAKPLCRVAWTWTGRLGSEAAQALGLRATGVRSDAGRGDQSGGRGEKRGGTRGIRERPGARI